MRGKGGGSNTGFSLCGVGETKGHRLKPVLLAAKTQDAEGRPTAAPLNTKGCGTREWSRIPRMLFMVIERFREDPDSGRTWQATTALVGERFKQKGRMLPEGVTYVESWMEPDGTKCFQIMEAANRELLDKWMSGWNDLVEFEVVPVVTVEKFWEKR